MTYSVKQLADIAGVSPRTLHYYDQIGLLYPSAYEDNGYRQYQEAEVYRLQQILFYKELGLELKDIKAILDRPDFDPLQALEEHKTALESKATRLLSLIDTVEATISHLKGEHPMSDKSLFKGWSEEQQKEYEQEAMQTYDPQKVKQSQQRWSSYTKEQRASVMDEGNRIFTEMIGLMEQGPEAQSVQALVKAYQDYITASFYDCTPEIIGGLGQAYVQDPRFKANFDQMQPGLAEFASEAFQHYARQHAEK